MALLISIPILGVLAILQSAVASNITLLLGTTDLLLVTLIAWSLQDRVKAVWQWSLIGGGMMALLSGLPVVVYPIAYLCATMLSIFIKKQIWKVPFLGMLMSVLIGTLLVQAISWVSRWITGVYIPLGDVLVFIILPSSLLNLFVAIPAYFVMRDLAFRIYPEEIKA